MILLGASVPVDSDAASPDSLRAATDVLIDQLLAKADARGVGIDWATAEIRFAPCDGEHKVIIQAEVL